MYTFDATSSCVKGRRDKVEVEKRNKCSKRYELMRKNAFCSSNNPQYDKDTKNWKSIKVVKNKDHQLNNAFFVVIHNLYHQMVD